MFNACPAKRMVFDGAWEYEITCFACSDVVLEIFKSPLFSLSRETGRREVTKHG